MFYVCQNIIKTTLDTLDIMPYTLDILMTHIGQQIELSRIEYGLSCLRWHGLSLHLCVSSCCIFPQRYSSITQPSRSTSQFFTAFQPFWWSHWVVPLLPRPRVRSVSSSPESSVTAKKDGFYENEDSIVSVPPACGLLASIIISVTSRSVETRQRTVRGTVVTDLSADRQTGMSHKAMRAVWQGPQSCHLAESPHSSRTDEGPA